MNKITKEKKQQIALILVAAAGVIAGLWFFVIQNQYTRLSSVQKKTGDMRAKVSQAETLLRKADTIESSLEENGKSLEKIEGAMASGDLYLWVINTINQFNVTKEVTFLDFQREQMSDVGIFPKFPYKAAIFPVKGTSHYHELGRFLADFENSFPYVRVQNLELAPSSKGTEQDGENLNFKFEIVSLIKPIGQ
ncbi:MAG: hypothetical protein ABIQ35_11320 [Verrucomicrobiota bacterium]